MVVRNVSGKDLKSALSRCAGTVLRDNVSVGRFAYLRMDRNNDGGCLVVATTNFQGITVIEVPSRDESGMAKLCVPFEKFKSAVDLLDGSLEIEIDMERRKLIINDNQVEMVGDDTDDFPEIPKMPELILAIDDVAGFRKAMNRAASGCRAATADHLKGIAFTTPNETIELLAADQFLAVLDRSIKSTMLAEFGELQVFIPEASIPIVSGFVADRIEVAIEEERGRLFLRGNNSYICVRTADFKFPLDAVRKTVPSPSVSVTVDAKEFSKAYRLAGLFTDMLKDNESIRIVVDWTETDMTIQSFRKRKGAQGAKTTIPAQSNGIGSIILNAKQTHNIGDIVAGGNTMTIGFTNEKKPYLITSNEIPGYVSFIMPINIKE